MKMRLLIADDNSRVRQLIKILVRRSFDRIFECYDGDEVVASYEKNRPDWVFLDIQMARVDGITAAKELISRHPDARIMMISNFDDEELRKTTLGIGVKYYLNKNELYSLESIINQIN